MSSVWITVGISAVVVAGLAIVYHGLDLPKTRGRDWKQHAIYGAVFVGCLFVPNSIAQYVFSSLTATVTGTVFPIYESVRALCTPEEGDDKAWLLYWMVGGVLFIGASWVDDLMSGTAVVYWYQSMFFFFVWLFFPNTDGAALVYDALILPYVAPKVRPLATKMNNAILALYQTMVNAAHLWVVWIIFLFLPAGLKRIIAVAIGTVYPLVSSITAAATEEVEDDSYWLTYWSCYGCLFLIMELLETWISWVPGFYTLIIFSTVYLMLPMFRGADKIFRNVLVPLAGLQELLMLRDAILVKKRMLEDLDPERSRAVRKAIAKFYNDDDGNADPAVLKEELYTGWRGMKMPSFSNPFNKEGEATEDTPLV